jgi:uncharacterized protein DUF4129
MVAATPQVVDRWSSSQIHDTVAAIARQPAFARSGRESLLGRFLRYVLENIRQLLNRYHGSPGARYVVIAGVVVLLVIIVARIVIIRDVDAQVRRRRALVRGALADADLWRAAQGFAAAGDYTTASHALYAGLLERVARAGGITRHPSKTGGDYWRELRRRGSPIAEEFRAFSRRFDRVMFGTGVATADDFNELSDLAERVLGTRRAA